MVRKVVRKKSAKKVAKKTAAKKVPRKRSINGTSPAKKAAAKKTAKKATTRKSTSNAERESYIATSPRGYREGSDSDLVVAGMIEGGADRVDVAEAIRNSLPSTVTKGGVEKNVSSLMSSMLVKLIEDGYKVESHWRLVPPAKVQRALDKAK